MSKLKMVYVNNWSPLPFSSWPSSLSHSAPPSVFLYHRFHLSSIFFSCRGWSGLAECPSAAKGVRGGVDGPLAGAAMARCSRWLSWWWRHSWQTRRRLRSRERQKKCRSWTLRWSWDARATSPNGTSERCGARRTPLTSMWSRCWSMRPIRKASSTTFATWCPGPRSTAWCLGMAPTRRPSPRFWILFPRRRSYPSSASTEGLPWSWRIR